METVTCSCSKCHAVIGRFQNFWDKIGKTYYSPICYNGQGLSGMITLGEVRPAPKAGAIENSFLQDLACQACGEKLGLRCDSAPEGHVLIQDQLILRVAGMTIVSDDTERKATLRVRRKFSLTGQQPTSADVKDIRERSASTTGTRPDIENGGLPPEATIVVPSNDSDPISGLLRFAEWAKDAIAGQKKDMDRVHSVVSRMEEDINSFRDYMSEMTKESSTPPGGKAWDRMKTDVKSLKEEVGQLRMEVEARPTSAFTSNEDGVSLSIEELEVLTNSITKLSQKVNEVESLKLELDFMKGRLKRFEEASRNFKQSLESRTVEISPTVAAYQNSMGPPTQRKASGASIESEAGPAHRTEHIPRKRKSDEFESSGTSVRIKPSDQPGKRRGRPPSQPAVPVHGSHLVITRKPSRLSNVQLADDVPDPVPVIDAGYFVDGNNSDSDVQPPIKPIREYDSAPETRPSHKRTLISRAKFHRGETSPEDLPQLSEKNNVLTAPFDTAPQRLAKNMSLGRRRAYSEGTRNADGVRLTKAGTPDRRTGNYKYLKKYYEKMKAQKENEGRGQGEGQREGEGEGEGQGHGLEEGSGGAGEKTDMDVLPSVEHEGTHAEETDAEETEEEKLKRAELEARDRLVKETLEREM